MSTTTEIDADIAAAAKAVYRKYGANLSAFWRDAFAAEAQRQGDQVEQYGVDGNCIHSIPICRRCEITGIEAHLKEKDAIRDAASATSGAQVAQVIDFFERESAKIDQQ